MSKIEIILILITVAFNVSVTFFLLVTIQLDKRRDRLNELASLQLTPVEKLEKLYSIREKLHPLTMILVVGFYETQNRKLGIHDEKFIEEVYPHYF